MKQIQLTGKHSNNLVATVDDEDYEAANARTWQLSQSGQITAMFYVDHKAKSQTLGRFIYSRYNNTVEGNVKYKDGNPLNCQRSNLFTKADIKEAKPKTAAEIIASTITDWTPPTIITFKTIKAKKNTETSPGVWEALPTDKTFGRTADGKWWSLDANNVALSEVTFPTYLDLLNDLPQP